MEKKGVVVGTIVEVAFDEFIVARSKSKTISLSCAQNIFDRLVDALQTVSIHHRLQHGVAVSFGKSVFVMAVCPSSRSR